MAKDKETRDKPSQPTPAPKPQPPSQPAPAPKPTNDPLPPGHVDVPGRKP